MLFIVVIVTILATLFHFAFARVSLHVNAIHGVLRGLSLYYERMLLTVVIVTILGTLFHFVFAGVSLHVSVILSVVLTRG